MNRKFYFSLTPLSITSTGTAVHAWELCHRLMRLANPLQVIPCNCPFQTKDKQGFPRIWNAILRDTIWDNYLVGLEATEQDYFIFPTQDVPPKFFKRQYATFVHDIAGWHNPKVTTFGGRIFSSILPQTLKNAHRIFTVSEYTAQDISHQFNIPKEQIIVAPNGLSQIYQIQAKPIKQINGRELPDKYFLHVGALDPKKNLSFLVKVYERFREQAGNLGNSVKLIFTGGEYYKKFVIELLEQIKNSPYSNDIIILGKVKSEELPYLYRGATAFIFPSTFEGFGLPVIEALSQGTPVLVNSNTSLTQFGEFGATIFDDFDLEKWATQLLKISQNKERIHDNLISSVRSYFSWDRTAKIVAESIGIINSHLDLKPRSPL